MDLLAYEAKDMYFSEPLDGAAEALIEKASEAYGQPQAETYLREAERIAPQHLTVLVALYRYYFYRHQHDLAFAIAEHVLETIARRQNLAVDWRQVTPEDIIRVADHSPELVRFYLHALKGAGYLSLRLEDPKGGLERLDKVGELDPKDRIGAIALATVAREAMQNETLENTVVN